MTFVIIGLAVGLLLVAGHSPRDRAAMTLHDRAIDAQRVAARATQHARDLAEAALEEQRRRSL